jgi:hypothetical protein
MSEEEYVVFAEFHLLFQILREQFQILQETKPPEALRNRSAASPHEFSSRGCPRD